MLYEVGRFALAAINDSGNGQSKTRYLWRGACVVQKMDIAIG
jgi:hypothetical protein